LKNYPQYLFYIFTLIWLFLAINPSYRSDWFLENILVIVFVSFLVWGHKKHGLSNFSYTLIFIFSVLHSVGAYYTYSEVPFAAYLSEILGLERNYYDRFVHFVFGLLITYPMHNLIKSYSPVREKWLRLFTITTMITFGEIYELIEWLTAIVVSPEAGVAFLGAQGDVFDAQKDVMCNLSGIFIANFIQLFTSRKN
jgi:putative membrane protein